MLKVAELKKMELEEQLLAMDTSSCALKDFHQTAINDIALERDDTRREVDTLQLACDSLTAKKDRYRQQALNLQSSYDLLNVKASNFENLLAKAYDDITKMENQTIEDKADIRRWRNCREPLNEDKEELQAQLNKLTEENDSANSMMSTKDMEIRSLQEEVTALRTRINVRNISKNIGASVKVSAGQEPDTIEVIALKQEARK